MNHNLKKESLFKKVSIDTKEVTHVAELANLALNESQIKILISQLRYVLGYVAKIQQLNIKNIRETSQVTGLKNIFRKDRIEKNRMLSQNEALSNSKKTHKGYFVVKSVFK